MVTMYCVKCDSKIESKTRDRICPKCGLPMFVFDEYMEDLKKATEAEKAESKLKTESEEVVSGEAVMPAPSTQEGMKPTVESAENPEKKEIDAGTDSDTEPFVESKTVSVEEEIISEGDEDETVSPVKTSAKMKPTLTTSKESDDTDYNTEETDAMDWKEMDWQEVNKSGEDEDSDTEENPEYDDVNEAAESMLKKGSKKKIIYAAAGIAAVAAGIMAVVKILNKNND